MEWMTSPEAWIALATLTLMEIVLGVDNIIFISVLVGRLPPEQRERARLVLSARLPPDAESELRALLEQAPEDPVLRSSLGFRLAVAGDAGRSAETLALLQALSDEKSTSPEVLANLGWAWYRMGRYLDASKSLAAALEIEPSRLFDRVRLGLVLGELGDTERAIEEVRTALGYEPGAPWADEAREHLRRFEARPEMAIAEDAGS